MPVRLLPSTDRPGDADVAPVAFLLAEPARVSMLLAVSDGRALPATELARVARVTRSGASAHLAKLVAGGLLDVERHGRHRYYRLAAPAIVSALEALAVVAAPAPARSAREGAAAAAVRFARTCYDHLAGALGVAITEALVARGALVPRGREYDVSPDGEALLAALGADLAAAREAARRARRPLARACLDWSERRHHLAGPLGGALASALIDRGWLARTPASRALVVTPVGRRELRRALGVTADVAVR